MPTQPFQPGSGSPLSMIDVLEHEFLTMHGHQVPPSDSDGAENRSESKDEKRERDYRTAVHGLAEKQTAICLSGGGVRSATFCLGVLQALAQKDLLGKFHYLSSVSGGGYIASWLSSWIARAQDRDAVLNDIAPNRANANTRPVSAEPNQIRRLRSYSNYLSPVHGFSLDFLTLIATFIRNLSLHWLIMLPLFSAMIILPRLYLALVSYLDQPDLNGGATMRYAMYVPFCLLLMGVGCMFFYLPPRSRPNQKRSYFGRLCLLPVVVAAFIESWNMRLLKQVADFPAFPLAIAAMLGFFAANVCQLVGSVLKDAAHTSTGRDFPWQKVICAGSGGALTAILIYGVIHIFTWLPEAGAWVTPFIHKGLYAVLFVPAVLTALWSGISLYVGLARKFSQEDEREWLARASAWLFWTILIWIAFTALVIFGPYLLLLSMRTKQIGASAGLLGVLTSAYGYWSKQASKVKSVISMAGARALELGAAIFIVMLVIGISLALTILADAIRLHNMAFAVQCAFGGESVADSYVIQTMAVGWQLWFVLCVCLSLIGLVASRYFGTNTFSLHNMYGNRLVRAYLGASRDQRDPDPFTGLDPDDSIMMSEIAEKSHGSPGNSRLYHVINIALNMVKPTGRHLDWQQRKAASFTVTPYHAGSECTDFQPAATYSSGKGISLARAMTISGAAASPNMGYHSSTLVAFVMTFFNIRLGWWLPNPGEAGRRYWDRSEPELGSYSISAESMAETTDTSKFLYLSDGGHFENLGLYEMVRRRCGKIVVVDASCDPKYEFEDLENAIRKIRIDFGIPIIFPEGLPTPAWTRSEQHKGRHAAHGIIRYSCVDGGCDDGSLIYIKPVLGGNEPLDITRYAEKSSKAQSSPFPHHSTSDQFFDEIQFESYRALGYHSVMADFPRDEFWKTYPELRTDDCSGSQPPASQPGGDEPPGSKPGVADAIQKSLQNMTLWTVVAASGALGAAGTYVIKEHPAPPPKQEQKKDDMAPPPTCDLCLPPQNDELLLQLQVLNKTMLELKQSIEANLRIDQSTSISINNAINKQLELIARFESSRKPEDLTAIKAALNLIQQSLNKNPDYSALLEKINASINTLDTNVNGNLKDVKTEVRKLNPRSSIGTAQESRP